MSLEAGQFENPGGWAREMTVGADVWGDGVDQGTPETTEHARTSPSQVGEDETTRDEVTRDGSSQAWRSRGTQMACARAVECDVGRSPGSTHRGPRRERD